MDYEEFESPIYFGEFKFTGAIHVHHEGNDEEDE